MQPPFFFPWGRENNTVGEKHGCKLRENVHTRHMFLKNAQNIRQFSCILVKMGVAIAGTGMV